MLTEWMIIIISPKFDAHSDRMKTKWKKYRFNISQNVSNIQLRNCRFCFTNQSNWGFLFYFFFIRLKTVLLTIEMAYIDLVNLLFSLWMDQIHLKHRIRSQIGRKLNQNSFEKNRRMKRKKNIHLGERKKKKTWWSICANSVQLKSLTLNLRSIRTRFLFSYLKAAKKKISRKSIFLRVKYVWINMHGTKWVFLILSN